MMHGLRASGNWGERGTNLLDTGAWFYEVYETADGGYISLGPIDARSCQEMLRITGLADDVDGGGPIPDQSDRDSWPSMKRRMAALIRTKTRDEWCSLLETTDACFAPVLGPEEAKDHPHNRLRGTFTEVGGVVQPAPAPRFSRTVPEIAGPPPGHGQHTDEALLDWGFSAEEINGLRSAQAIS
jgi:alpha-methylacyl-CoA racemase